VKKQNDADEDSGAEDFRLDEFLPYRLCVAAESVSHLMARHYLADLDLVLPEWRLLAAVGRFGILSPTVAGERTAMDKVKVSRAAASLVARGLLRQTQDPADGRGRLLRLTRKGTTIYTNVAPTARAIETALAPGLTKAEWGVLAKALSKLSEHARSVLAEKTG
jgi:DNA-binding MarR family transcriptional regulator